MNVTKHLLTHPCCDPQRWNRTRFGFCDFVHLFVFVYSIYCQSMAFPQYNSIYFLKVYLVIKILALKSPFKLPSFLLFLRSPPPPPVRMSLHKGPLGIALWCRWQPLKIMIRTRITVLTEDYFKILVMAVSRQNAPTALVCLCVHDNSLYRCNGCPHNDHCVGCRI